MNQKTFAVDSLSHIMNRRKFLTGIISSSIFLTGCSSDSSSGSVSNGTPSFTDPSKTSKSKTVATSKGTRTPESTTTPEPTSKVRSATTQHSDSDLPAVCADSIHFEALSPAAQDEFKKALTNDGLTKSNLNFSIVKETRDSNGLDTINDQTGGEVCVVYNGTYYFGTIGLGVPITDTRNSTQREYRYELQFERAKLYDTTSTNTTLK